MMAVAYIFALVVGGGFMALSLLGDVAGGGDVADVDLDLDLDLDADLDVDAGGGSDVNALKILSLRTLVYALFGFGAVGTILTQMWGGAQASQTALFATAGGVATGFIASALFGFLRRSEVGDRAGEASFVGLPGFVSLPIGPGSPGQVTVLRGDRSFRIRALPHDTAGHLDPGAWKEVLVVEMDAGIARVVPVDEELRLPDGG
jgi:hypothetical protein